VNFLTSREAILPQTVIDIWVLEVAERHLRSLMMHVEVFSLGLVVLLRRQSCQLSRSLWHLLMELNLSWWTVVRYILAIPLLLPLNQIVFDDVGIDVSASGRGHIPCGPLRFPLSYCGLLGSVLFRWRAFPALVLG
jgi:hypothetical protein